MAAKNATFSPVFDVIANDKRIGTIGALVFGVVWRHCQLRNHKCYASKENLAGLTGLNRKTIREHLTRLVDAGYIDDLTPDKRYTPHTYTITEYAKSILETSGTDSITSTCEDSGTSIPNSDTSIPSSGTVGITQWYSRYQEDTKLKKTVKDASGTGGSLSSKDLDTIRAYTNLHLRLLKYFMGESQNYHESQLENCDAILGLMLDEVGYWQAIGERIAPEILTDEDYYEQSMCAVGAIGVESSLVTELFRGVKNDKA